MAALETQVYEAIKAAMTAAQAPAGLLEYVKANSLIDGRFLTEPSGTFPLVAMDMESVDEVAHTVPDRARLTYKYQIYCAVEDIDWGRSILGDGTLVNVGIIKLVNDVKNAISGDLRLGLASAGVIRIRFSNTRYFVENFPIREAVITAEVEATVTKQGR